MKRIGDILSKIIGERGSAIVKERRTLLKSWESILKKSFTENPPYISAMAKRTRILSIADNVLTVEADHTGWIQILQTKENVLLAILRGCFSCPIDEINFVLKKF